MPIKDKQVVKKELVKQKQTRRPQNKKKPLVNKHQEPKRAKKSGQVLQDDVKSIEKKSVRHIPHGEKVARSVGDVSNRRPKNKVVKDPKIKKAKFVDYSKFHSVGFRISEEAKNSVAPRVSEKKVHTEPKPKKVNEGQKFRKLRVKKKK